MAGKAVFLDRDNTVIEDPGYISDPKVVTLLPGVELALDRAAQEARGLWHPRNGEILLVAKPGYWFAYPWWEQPREAPDYASHVDIHNKPGYDPCELFFGWPPPGISQDPTRIRGTHGRTGPEMEIAWTASWKLDSAPATLTDLAHAVAAHG